MFRSTSRGRRALLSLVVIVTSTTAAALPAASRVSATPPVPQPSPAIVPGPDPGLSEIFGAIGNRLVIVGQTPATGEELYVHDTVAGTTTLLADIRPGANGSGPRLIARLGDRLLLSANDVDGDRIWVTDGTVAGTVLVKDPATTGTSELFGWDQDAGAPVLDGFAYFGVGEPTTGGELWRSDGTTDGTTIVADLSAGAATTAITTPVVFAGKVYFGASLLGVDPSRLWRTDGTSLGTEIVEPTIDNVVKLAAASSGLVFSATDPADGNRIMYRTDGVPGTATPLQDLAGNHTIFSVVEAFAGGRAFFAGTGSVSAQDGLWVTDGTRAGTLELVPTGSMQLGGVRIFRGLFAWIGFSSATGQELWLSDGTPAGTRALELLPGVDGGADSRPLVHSDGWLYLVGSLPGGTGPQLLRTDGTIVEAVSADGDFSSVFDLRSAGDRVYFRGETTAEGRELWYLDAPPAVPSVTGTPVATAGSLSASVTWPASTALPAAPVTGYTVTASPGGATCTTTGALTCTVSGLSAGTSYTFTVVATNRIGSSAASAVSNAVVPTAPPVVSLAPGRILDTRTGPDFLTVDGQFQATGQVTAGSTLELTVAGRANVPADASAAMLNVTAIGPDAAGFLTVYPCGGDRPNASSVNYQANQVVPNAVLAKIGTAGQVCIFSTAMTHLVVDVNGAVPAGGSPATVQPARLLETRNDPLLKTVDGQFQGGGRIAADTTLELQVAGRGNVPANASAVMLNVTAVTPAGPGFLTVFPCGTDKPNASSVNYAAGQVVPNAVLAKIGTDGKVCIYSLAAADVLVDVNGFVPAGSKPTPLSPARLLETRVGPDLKTVDGQFQGGGRVAAGGVVELLVTGRGNVPADASAVMLNVTAVAPSGPGFVTVYPCGEQPPRASTVNYAAGQVVPNAVLAKIGTGGTVCLFTLAQTDLVVDVTAST